MGRLGGSLTSSVWFMDSDLVLFRSQRFVFWLVEAFGKSLQAFFASRMVRRKLVRSFIAHAQALARCHANASSRAPVASRGKQGARARGHSGFEQVSFSWLSAERVGSSTLPGSRFTFHHDFIHADQSGIGWGLTFLHRQRATFVCKVLLCRPTYQWPIACALNHATAQNGMEQ